MYTTFPGIYSKQVNFNQSSFISSETCRCDITSDCVYPAGVCNQSKIIILNEVFSLDASLLFTVPGFQVGCVPQNALLQSTLECFYNQSCLNKVISLTGAIHTVSIRHRSNSSAQFHPTTTIGIIFDNMMLESWQNATNFDGYFQACAPKVCSYSYRQRFVFIYMITILISIYGGLSVVLRVASPLFVKFILRGYCQRFRILETNEEREPTTNLRNRLVNLDRLIYNQVITFNMFKTTFTNVQHGIYCTRVYIILLIIGLCVLFIHYVSKIQSQEITIRNPSVNQFEKLYGLYSSILSCPCSRSLIPRSAFMNNQLRFHPFCTSAFVQDDSWLQYWTMIFLNGTIDYSASFDWADFRKNGQRFINYARIYCEFAMTTVTDMLNIFHTDQFFSYQLITREEFNEQLYIWNTSLYFQVEYGIWDDLKQNILFPSSTHSN
ncbi:unnamed protein product [Rotaria sp. Silwood2]|nr:unnamed protein product [Rotaria sp. Silwood2]CAF4597675.1 unnamed protein product [Rotaria sp. Silwood2]